MSFKLSINAQKSKKLFRKIIMLSHLCLKVSDAKSKNAQL